MKKSVRESHGGSLVADRKSEPSLFKEERKAFEKWMDGEEVCRLLRLSPKTLQGMRDKGIIACSQVGKKFYYRTEDVEGFISGKQKATL